MIQAMGEYVVSLAAAAILCSVLVSLFTEGIVRSLLTVCCGVVLTVTVLSPLPGLSIPELTVFAEHYWEEGQNAAACGTAQAEESRQQCIKEGLRAYILDKARSLGVSVQAEVTLDPDGIPVAVTISGSCPAQMKERLAAIITNDLGIPEEDQQWNARNGQTESQMQLENTAGQP